MENILAYITELREARGWSEYQLAEQSGVPQSTISSWYRKNVIPTLPPLMKICDVFGITLSQLFAGTGDSVMLTSQQKELLQVWAKLTSEQKAVIFALIENM